MAQPKARVGIDTAGGGVIEGPGCPTVLINGAPVATVGDAIANHGTGAHASAHIVEGSATVKACGKAVARLGDLCSCGHTIESGSPDVEAG